MNLFPSERPHASTLDVKFLTHATMNWYDTMMFTLKKKLLTQNTVKKELWCQKKRVNYSNNKERCSAGNLADIL